MFVVPALAGLLRYFPPEGGTTNLLSWLLKSQNEVLP